ncbi:SMI1/KNR4 family protein [Meiothermus sp. CFH 77666]|uniref:SMI1/KNR4 family protein n=1 Tax=Meiothermus sp. CFH 77666 TaxID=2817942 RepID=UPI001AA06298|nr:SMI1/KNR4 family protein [Meiothermus sp. CFH 77666]MBO1435895.1 SMI1/KNR4 family protein [Meiothermus sp. CFH 77666]
MSRKNFDEALGLLSQNKDLLEPEDIVGELEESVVSDAENELDVVFPPMFRTYLLEYGQITVGSEEIYGLMGGKYPGGAVPDLLWLTKALRSKGFPKYFLPIADLGDGRLFVIDLSRRNEENESPVALVFPSAEIPSAAIETVFDDFGDFLLDTVRRGLKGILR